MYTRTFHCTGFDGKPYDVTYDFHLSKADMLKINYDGGLGLFELLQKLIDENEGAKIMAILDKIIMTAVGRESLDHRRFLQDEEIKKDFRESEAYSQLFEELCTNGEKASEFINGCLPEQVKREIAERQKEETEKKAE